MEKWYELLKSIQFEGVLNVMSLEDLQEFEKDNNMSFPKEYKEFCQVFGSGFFGNEIRIDCPPEIERSPILRSEIFEYLENLKKLSDFPVDKAVQITKLLKNALFFGSTGNSEVFLWNLATENCTDSNYDIYMTNLECFECEGGEIEIVGRSFYTFIKDIALKNLPFTGVMSKYTYPDEMFQPRFSPLLSRGVSSDFTVTRLVTNHPVEFANWLLGSSQALTCADSEETWAAATKLDLLILKTEDTILQIEVKTRLDPNIPIQFFNDYLRLSTQFPDKNIRQVVIYLKPTNSPLVHLTSYEASNIKHDFEVIRLWEQPTDLFLTSHVLTPLAVLSNTPDKQETLRQTAKIIEEIEYYNQSNVSFDAAVLAWLVLDEEVVSQILQIYKEIDWEIVTKQLK
ncbi:SMI1/KNR4 family protein [Pseudanabaena sp. BC1403]|uniref:SMI1/KNR4 family protein n=1 Tax=Pseudanabaena sp. BC1403 TaxID=2043171 RepID=UPI000CD875A7|nr:SMI1/KNR4 family protein [Pseudanabaena sp. BC1403]